MTPEQPGLTGADALAAFVWLSDRSRNLLTSSYGARQLVADAAADVRAARCTVPYLPASLTWQQAAALEFVRGHAGVGHDPSPRVFDCLTADPDGVLLALAELLGQMFRLHDGEGAAALVRALNPAAIGTSPS